MSSMTNDTNGTNNFWQNEMEKIFLFNGIIISSYGISSRLSLSAFNVNLQHSIYYHFYNEKIIFHSIVKILK